MDNQPTSAVAARVSTPSGQVVGIPEGSRLVFGRGPDADLTVAAGRGLSRRAGLISAVAGGAWIANISQTHALYTEGDGYRIRLPRMDEHGEVPGASAGRERSAGDRPFGAGLPAGGADPIRVLRRKISDGGLARGDTGLSDGVVGGLLIEPGIITAADLGRLNDPAWCSRQED